MANVADFDEVTAAVAHHHGLDPEDALRVIEALGIKSTDDREYLYRNPGKLEGFDVTGDSQRIAGCSGWVVYFAESDTAISVRNGDPEHHENVLSLAEAVAAASGEGSFFIDGFGECVSVEERGNGWFRVRRISDGAKRSWHVSEPWIPATD